MGILLCTVSGYFGLYEAVRVKKMYNRKRAEYEAVNLHYLQRYNTTNEHETNFEESQENNSD